MKLIEVLELKECIDDLCEARKIPTDLRFYRLADVNGFIADSGEVFEVKCDRFYAKDVDDIKTLFSELLTALWACATLPNHKVALYVKDIVDRNGWYDVIVGGCLFESE